MEERREKRTAVAGHSVKIKILHWLQHSSSQHCPGEAGESSVESGTNTKSKVTLFPE